MQFLMLFLFSLFTGSILAQQAVTGVVSDDLGELLPGVTVLEKGTSNGTVTDFDGKFVISVSGSESILLFSSVGMQTKERNVGSQSTLSVVLLESTESLDEVVVTALGITREKKALGYSVGEVDGEELAAVPQENVLNAIAGRVSGVAVSSVGGPGSSVSMVIRGATSLSSDNQPLFVIDGVPVANTLNNVGGFGSRVSVDYGNAISDINPDDIESMTVLKGPSAAALYGSRAGNGVVIITTKSGKASKGLGVSINSSTVFDVPYKYVEGHTKFATGGRPYTPTNNPTGGDLILDERTSGWVGPELDKGYSAVMWPYTADELNSGVAVLKPLTSRGANNPENFYQTAITSTNNISIQDNTEKIDYRLSYTNMTHEGFTPNSDLGRNSISLNSSLKLTDNFKVTSSLNYTKSGADNRPSGNRGANPYEALFKLNTHIDVRDMTDYWLPGFEGEIQNAPYNWGDDPSRYKRENPYFIANEVNNSFDRNRVFGNLRADWDFTDYLTLMVRYNYDDIKEVRETKITRGYTRERNGLYGIRNISRVESNAEALLSFNKTFNDDWSLNASIGGNLRKENSANVSNSSKSGAGLIVPNVFVLGNIAPENLQYHSATYEKQVNSIYGMASIGYKNIAYLDITGRNDWSSTLPEENRSYFYPSISGSLLLNNIFDMGTNVSLVKLRAGWAQVGNDTGPYRLSPTLHNGGAWGDASQLVEGGELLTPDLKPEIQTSYEFGADFSFFHNRLRLDGTYYQADNTNQILSVDLPQSSGYSRKLINAGLLRSKGFEASLGITAVETDDWNWDLNFVYSKNRTTVVELAEGLDYIKLWSDAKGGAYTWVGEEIGNLIDRSLIRVDDPNSPYHGWPLLNDSGEYRNQNDVGKSDENGKRISPVVGNFNPDFMLGLQTSVTYKNWKLAMSFDWRSGGQFVSQTMRYSESDLASQRWIDRTYDLSGQADIAQYIRDNEDTFLSPGGPVYPLVGGPTEELGGFPYTGSDGITLNDGTFLPGVIGSYDANGNFVLDQENIGDPGTKMVRYGDNYPWSLMSAATFDADFLKLRDVSISYLVPFASIKRTGLQSLSIGIFSRNIMLWTKAGIGIDPENAFQPENGVQGSGIQFKQGIERYNLTPWAIPVGIKLNVTF